MNVNEIILGLIGAGAEMKSFNAETMAFLLMVDDHRVDLLGTRSRDVWQIVTEFFEISGNDPVALYEQARDAIQDIALLNKEKDAQVLKIISRVQEKEDKVK